MLRHTTSYKLQDMIFDIRFFSFLFFLSLRTFVTSDLPVPATPVMKTFFPTSAASMALCWIASNSGGGCKTTGGKEEEEAFVFVFVFVFVASTPPSSFSFSSSESIRDIVAPDSDCGLLC